MELLYSIESKLKSLRFNGSPVDYVADFLSALGFPSSTIDKLRQGALGPNASRTEFTINRRIIFRFTTAYNLLDELDSLVSKQKKSKHIQYSVIFNKSTCNVYSFVTKEFITAPHYELFKYLEVLLPIAGVPLPSLRLVNKDVSVAETIGELYNELILGNHGKEGQLKQFILQVIALSFINSLDTTSSGAIERYYGYIADNAGEKLSKLSFDLLQYANGSLAQGDLPEFVGKIPVIPIDLFAEVYLLHISRKSASLICALMKCDWGSVNSDIIGSMVYKFVGNSNETIGLHYTAASNVCKLFNPLLLNDLYTELSRTRSDIKALCHLASRLSRIKIFDPTNGSGCFLNTAFKELNSFLLNLNAEIQKLDGEKMLTAVPFLNHFYAIIDNLFGVHLSRLILTITYFQRNRDQYTLSRFSTIYESPTIVLGNPLTLDWSQVCHNDGSTYIVGSPVFKGAKKLNRYDKEDLKCVFGNLPKLSFLDYSTAWLYKCAEYISGSTSRSALVVTNSVTQGEQVSVLWPAIRKQGCIINFACTSFRWKNSVFQNTAVTVVIIGLCASQETVCCTLYSDSKSYSAHVIGPYLTIGTETVVGRRKEPLVACLPKMSKGNMPYENGKLLLDKCEASQILDVYPGAKRYIKKVVGSKEFIHGVGRWCIWIKDEDLDDAMTIDPIRNRVELVRTYRSKSNDTAVKKMADRSHQFRETRCTTTQSALIPSVSSENRLYIPMGFVGSDTIITNLAVVIYDCEPWLLGVLQSKMHQVWITTVCGKLETRNRYSSELGYNNFPFPEISDATMDSILSVVLKVLRVRESYSEMTLGDMYNEGTMPGGLKVVHQELDLVIDACYREEPFEDDTDRINYLFKMYDSISSTGRSTS